MLLMYCVRWRAPRPELEACYESGYGVRDFVASAVAYLLWQALYAIKTEVVDREFLDTNMDYLTSLRCLTTDHKNSMNKLVLSATRSMGIMRKTEFFDPSTAKTKLIFMTSQFIYTVIIMVLIPIIYSNYFLTTLSVAYIAWSGIYNGSSYYIDVFSHRYQLQFEKEKKLSGELCSTTDGGPSSEEEKEKLKES
jgi:hypothetical protein